MKKVLVTGLGFITSIGNTKDEVLHSLQTLKHGIVEYEPFQDPQIPVKLAAPVKGFDLASTDPEDWTYPTPYKVRRDVLRSLPPHGLYAYCAMRQALEDAGLSEADISNVKTGLYTASAGSPSSIYHHLNRMHTKGIQRCTPMGVIASIAGTLNFNLVSAFKIKGSSTGFVSACASSGHAINSACDEITLGRQERMIVIGAEDGNLSSILPFACMRALTPSTDPDKASRPFDLKRDGFIGTGGAVVMVLEAEDVAKSRNAKIYGEIPACAQASDGYNVAIPDPEGNGLERAMRLAIERAGIKPEQIDYVNAHATSTPIGDLAELKALHQVFGGNSPAISSTKALTGHGLSFSSIMEAAFSALCIVEGFMPGSAHIDELDPAANGLNILRETVQKAPTYALSNSSGFGGANVSIILKRYQDS